MDDHGGGRGIGVAGVVVIVVLGGAVALMLAMGLLLVLALSLTGFDVNLHTDPGKGTESKHLAVSVTPTGALQDGSVVRIRSSAFEAETVVSVAVCLSTADTGHHGADVCDRTTGARYAVGATRVLDATYAVPPAIGVGGHSYDCAARAQRCMVVAASADDFNDSGGQRLTFGAPMGPPRPPPATRPPTDHLPMLAWAAGPVMVGQQVPVTARGFQPGEPLLVAICGPSFATRGDVFSCKPRDAYAAYGALVFHGVHGIRDVADAGGTFTTVVKVPARNRSVGGSATTCAKAPGACSVVVTAAADTKRSGVLPLTVLR